MIEAVPAFLLGFAVLAYMTDRPEKAKWLQADSVFHTLRKALSEGGHTTNVGDEGDFAPNLSSAEDALDFIMRSIETAGYRPGRGHDAGARLGRHGILQGW